MSRPTDSKSATSNDKPKDNSADAKKAEGEDGESVVPRAANTSVSAPPINLVIIHPLVLLSVVDHYTRSGETTSRRVVGVLLGEMSGGGKVDCTNSYAVPFEEDPNDPNVWFIDRQYHDDMYAMFKKVNGSERIVGWYSSGPKLLPVDLAIHELFRQYTPHPALVIINVNGQQTSTEIPTLAYVSVESRPEDSSVTRRQFIHCASQIGATEPEEVGVEHLLRNIRDVTDSSLSDKIHAKLNSLKALRTRLHTMANYIDSVTSSKLPLNHSILAHIQDLFNTLPDLTQPQLTEAMSVASNDNMMVVYVSSLIRAVVAMHELIDNKIQNKDFEKEEKLALTHAGDDTKTKIIEESKEEESKDSNNKDTNNDESMEEKKQLDENSNNKTTKRF